MPAPDDFRAYYDTLPALPASEAIEFLDQVLATGSLSAAGERLHIDSARLWVTIMKWDGFATAVQIALSASRTEPPDEDLPPGLVADQGS